MDRGLYAASSGGLLAIRRLEVISNNLANASTVGFKAERIVNRQQEFGDTLASTLPGTAARGESDSLQIPGVVTLATRTDFTAGPISTTGNPLNVALRKPNQFFTVQTPEGEALTRAGNFTLNSDGVLVTQDGLPVLGDGGPITLSGGEPNISGNGSVSVGKDIIAKLRVVEVQDLTQLKRTEGVRFKADGARSEPVPADIVPASLEMPNISAVDAMVDMISAQRGFEAYAKTTRTIDELNERVLRNARTSG